MVDRKDAVTVNDARIRSERSTVYVNDASCVPRIASSTTRELVPERPPQRADKESYYLYDMVALGRARPQEGNSTAQAGLGQEHPVFPFHPITDRPNILSSLRSSRKPRRPSQGRKIKKWVR